MVATPLQITQASNIAKLLKASERGEEIDVRFAEKITEARKTESIKCGIFTNTKLIFVTLPWTVIAETTEEGLTEYILNQMVDEPPTVN